MLMLTGLASLRRENSVCFISEKQPKNISNQEYGESPYVGLELILKEFCQPTNCFKCKLGGTIPLNCGPKRCQC